MRKGLINTDASELDAMRIQLARKGDLDSTTDKLAALSTLVNNLVSFGNDAAKPAAGTADRIYFATDTKYIYLDNGVAWVQIFPTLPFTKEYTSSEQTITSAGALTLAHGLGVEPKIVSTELVCKTAEGGYSIDDVLVTSPTQEANSTADNRGISIVKDSTNLNIRFASATVVFLGLNKTTGAAFSLTNANWKLIVKAWA